MPPSRGSTLGTIRVISMDMVSHYFQPKIIKNPGGMSNSIIEY